MKKNKIRILPAVTLMFALITAMALRTEYTVSAAEETPEEALLSAAEETSEEETPLPGESDVDFDKTIENTYLGASMFRYPSTPRSTDDEWKGDYVYFGHRTNDDYYETNLYRVLCAGTTKFSKDGTEKTLFVDSGYAKVKDLKADDYYMSRDHRWENCELRAYLNGENFLERTENIVFEPAEKDAIIPSYGYSGSGEMSSYDHVSLKGDRIFVLDPIEATTNSFGFFRYKSDHFLNVKTQYGGIHTLYLRSSEEKFFPVYRRFNKDITITYYDQIAGGQSDGERGASPAFNINFASILFSSRKSFNSPVKLTILDDDLTTGITSEQKVKIDGSRVIIPYTLKKKNAANANTLSVIILDKLFSRGNDNNARLLYYKQLKKGITFNAADISEGTVIFNLPEGYEIGEWGSSYNVYLIAEKINGKKQNEEGKEWLVSDFSSVPCELRRSDLDLTTEYKVKFDLNGVSGTPPEPANVKHGQTLTRPEDPLVTGYVFKAWYKDAACTEQYNFNNPVYTSMTLYAKLVQSYNLWVGETEVTNYNCNDILGNKKVSYDPVTKVLYFDDFEKGKNTDIGKYSGGTSALIFKKPIPGDDTDNTLIIDGKATLMDDEIGYGIQSYEGTVILNGDIRLEGFKVGVSAKGIVTDGNLDILTQRNDAMYGISAKNNININGGCLTVTVPDGEKPVYSYQTDGITVSDKMTKWEPDGLKLSDDKKYFLNADTSTADHIKLSGQVQHTVFFSLNGKSGKNPGSQRVPDGGKAMKPETDPETDDAIFDGWYADKKCTVPYDFSTSVMEDIYIYAGWGSNTKYTVTFNLNGMEGPAPAVQEVYEGKTASRPSDPSAQDYDFIGWFSDGDSDEPFDFSTPITEDTLLYARWMNAEVKTYSVKFDLNGHGKSEIPEQVIEEGGTVRKPEDPVDENWLFTGWYTDKEAKLAYDLASQVKESFTLYAGWKMKPSGPDTKPDTKPDGETVSDDNLQHIRFELSTKNPDQSDFVLEITTVKRVDYNSKKHVSGYNKVNKSSVADVSISVNSVAENGMILSYALPAPKFKNNKNATASGNVVPDKKKPHFILSFKAVKAATKEQKKLIKQLNKELKTQPVYFMIEPADLSKAVVTAKVDPVKKKATKVTATINGIPMKLGKKDYTVEFDGDKAIIVGKGNFKNRQEANKQ